MPPRIDMARSALHQLPPADRLLLLDPAGISIGERQQLLLELADAIVNHGADAPDEVRAWAEMWLSIGAVQEAVAS